MGKMESKVSKKLKFDRIAPKYQSWLASHPKANVVQKAAKFDALFAQEHNIKVTAGRLPNMLGMPVPKDFADKVDRRIARLFR